jgi:uncharacterized membrane protein
MTLADVMLIISIIATGLFAGLMLTLVVILQKMWLQMPPTDYMQSMQTFLPAAKGNPIITVITLLPILAPILALIDLRANPSSRTFLLTLMGLVLAVGPFVVTLRFNFPVYNAMMNWQPEQPQAGWQALQMRFFVLNVVRLLLALAALLCFVLALASLGTASFGIIWLRIKPDAPIVQHIVFLPVLHAAISSPMALAGLYLGFSGGSSAVRVRAVGELPGGRRV